jgi:hypothetical protein
MRAPERMGHVVGHVRVGQESDREIRCRTELSRNPRETRAPVGQRWTLPRMIIDLQGCSEPFGSRGSPVRIRPPRFLQVVRSCGVRPAVHSVSDRTPMGGYGRLFRNGRVGARQVEGHLEFYR